MSKKRIVIGNWKMYVDSVDEAKKFASTLRKKSRSFVGAEAWLAPAFPLISPVALALGVSQNKKQQGSAIKLGAQTLSAHVDAPHTGEVSAKMLKSLGASFVIIGHSERRAQSESDEIIRAQLMQAALAGLVTVLCVGEHEREPDGSHFAEVANQLSRALHELKPATGKLVVAYEPVWAIGKTAAEAMQGQELEEIAIFIRKILAETLGREAGVKVPILYGGSVEATNAAALIKEGGVQGLLVGHASADVDSFIDILKACKK
ncbi:MAG TPA: triose-phosphate isomerase [Candidatus Paceibacterota bacterium]|nr:triose-phosphate isomerase [Candidatus Paceibacterota bacterium]